MSFPHLFISALWFVSSFVSIYPYILGFKNTEELKESFSFIWTFSIICAISCFGTISVVYAMNPTGPENVLDWNNAYHLASLFANASFISMALVKDTQTRVIIKQTPIVIGEIFWMIIERISESVINLVQKQKNYMAK